MLNVIYGDGDSAFALFCFLSLQLLLDLYCEFTYYPVACIPS